jgi:hypothetical protein
MPRAEIATHQAKATLLQLHAELGGKILDNKAEAERLREARAAAFLKHKLREGEVTYIDLAKRLKKHGFKETEASITMKLKRGTFPATFFLACLATAIACKISLV